MPALVQVVAGEDLDPSIEDESELIDVENPSAPPLLADASIVSAYRERLGQLSRELSGFCLSNHLPWIQIRSDASFDDLLRACLDAGLLALHT